MDTNAVKVTLWGDDVGYLYWDRKQKLAVFEYAESFLSKGLDISPFSMPILSIIHTAVVVARPKDGLIS